MEKIKKFRLDFIDVIRAFAICMMLQGHFVNGLIADRYRDENNFIYWLFRDGFTCGIFSSMHAIVTFVGGDEILGPIFTLSNDLAHTRFYSFV